MVKFAPAGALTGMRRKVHVLAARNVSKNRFWGLLGSIIVAGIIAYIASYAAMLIGGMVGLAGLFTGDTAAAFGSEDPAAIGAALSSATSGTGFKIGALFAIVCFAFGNAFYILMLMGPSAFFTKQWAESDPSAVFQ